VREEAVLLGRNDLAQADGNELNCQFLRDAFELHARIGADRNQPDDRLWLFAIIPGCFQALTQIW